MSTRYGNSGGRGRRITDWDDQPLSDAPVPVSKLASGRDVKRVVSNFGRTRRVEEAAADGLYPHLVRNKARRTRNEAAAAGLLGGGGLVYAGAKADQYRARKKVAKGIRADNDFDRHRRTRAGLALATGASAVPLFANNRAGYVLGGTGIATGATLMARNTPGKRKPKASVEKYDNRKRNAAIAGGTTAVGLHQIGALGAGTARVAEDIDRMPGGVETFERLSPEDAKRQVKDSMKRGYRAAHNPKKIARFVRHGGAGTVGVGLGLSGAAAGIGYAATRKKDPVGKTARYYDPEGRRQRRLGLAEAALLGGGGALGYRGGRGIVRSTKLIRGSKVTDARGGDVVPKKLLTATRRDLAQVGGGAALVGGAAAVDYHGNHPRGRHWR